VFLVIGLVMPLASMLTWAERRQSAMMQDRLGPNRANIGPIKLKGILHFVADAVKMIFKEDFIPANVHKRPVRAGADPGAGPGAGRVLDHPVWPDRSTRTRLTDTLDPALAGFGPGDAAERSPTRSGCRCSRSTSA
jgi:hypothetical protein